MNGRDQAKTEAIFGTLWLVLIAFMIPGALIMQSAAHPLFDLWTRGKMSYDPVLFGMLTLAVLVLASSEPAIAIIQGNNLLSIQLALSILAGASAIVVLFVLVPILGIRGAAISLLLAEIVLAFGYQLIAVRWMKKNKMHWPWASSNIIAASVVFTGFAIAGMNVFHSHTITVLILSLILNVIFLFAYWRVLPGEVRHRIATMIEGKLNFRMTKNIQD